MKQGQISSYIEFAQKVKGRQWTKRMTRRKFLQQVEKGDYDKADTYKLIEYLFSIGKSKSVYAQVKI